MYVKEISVESKIGLHARFAATFVQKANECEASVWLERDERRVNAKSLLGILSLDIANGAQIKIIADGPDEENAVNNLVAFIEEGFSVKA